MFFFIPAKNKSISYELFFLLTIIFIYSCSSTGMHKSHVENDDSQGADIPKISTEIVSKLLSKLYDFENRRKVFVNILKVEGSYGHDPKTAEYVKFKIAEFTERRFQQIKIVDAEQHGSIKINLFEKDGKPNIAVALYDDKNQFFYAENFILNKNIFSSPEFLDFKKYSSAMQSSQLPSLHNKKTAFLKIAYEHQGWQKTGGYYSESLESAVYPIDIECYINSKQYKPCMDNIFINENVLPGKYTITLSFKGARWQKGDGYFDKGSQSVITSEMKKTFELHLDENEIQHIKAMLKYTWEGAMIAVQPLGYVSLFDNTGKFLKSYDIEKPKPYVFPENELAKISNLISKYSLYKVIEALHSVDGKVTIEVNNQFQEVRGYADLKFVNNKTIHLDFKRNNLSVEEAEKLILRLQTLKDEQARKAEEQNRARQRALDEQARRIEEAKQQKMVDDAIKAYQRTLAEEEKKEQEKKRYEQDMITQVLPNDYENKIKKYLRRILIDPDSMQISSISNPERIVLSHSHQNLSPGNIVWQCEVCYNAKNRFGGYTGLKCYDLLFRDGEVLTSH
jgi:hypothetical protein